MRFLALGFFLSLENGPRRFFALSDVWGERNIVQGCTNNDFSMQPPPPPPSMNTPSCMSLIIPDFPFTLHKFPSPPCDRSTKRNMQKLFWIIVSTTSSLCRPYPQYGWDSPEETPERPRKTLSELFLGFPSSVGLGTPDPTIQGIRSLQSISRILSPSAWLLGRLFFQKWFRKGH